MLTPTGSWRRPAGVLARWWEAIELSVVVRAAVIAHAIPAPSPGQWLPDRTTAAGAACLTPDLDIRRM